MSDICLALCFAYLGGFVATFALAANYIFENVSDGLFFTSPVKTAFCESPSEPVVSISSPIGISPVSVVRMSLTPFSIRQKEVCNEHSK